MTTRPTTARAARSRGRRAAGHRGVGAPGRRGGAAGTAGPAARPVGGAEPVVGRGAARRLAGGRGDRPGVPLLHAAARPAPRPPLPNCAPGYAICAASPGPGSRRRTVRARSPGGPRSRGCPPRDPRRSAGSWPRWSPWTAGPLRHPTPRCRCAPPRTAATGSPSPGRTAAARSWPSPPPAERRGGIRLDLHGFRGSRTGWSGRRAPGQRRTIAGAFRPRSRARCAGAGGLAEPLRCGGSGG